MPYTPAQLREFAQLDPDDARFATLLGIVIDASLARSWPEIAARGFIFMELPQQFTDPAKSSLVNEVMNMFRTSWSVTRGPNQAGTIGDGLTFRLKK